MSTKSYCYLKYTTIICLCICIILGIVNYFLPASPVKYTGGVMLVIIVTIIMLFLVGFRHQWSKHRAFKVLLDIITIILFCGTIFAAYLLHTWFFLIVILIAFACYLLSIAGGNKV